MFGNIITRTLFIKIILIVLMDISYNNNNLKIDIKIPTLSKFLLEYSVRLIMIILTEYFIKEYIK